MNSKIYIPIITAFMYGSLAQAYLTQIENATSATIKVKINLAKCKPLDIGEIRPGKKSKIFDTGACCFESIHVIAIDGAIKGADSGVVIPWGKGWQCFQNIYFKCYEIKDGDRTTGLKVEHSTFKK